MSQEPGNNGTPQRSTAAPSKSTAMTKASSSVSGGDPTVLTDVKTIRERARHSIDRGAVTDGYALDRQMALRLLNEALATELVCWLRYRNHYYTAHGIRAEVAAAEFLEHADQEARHGDMLAQRIVQLGGNPDMNPGKLLERSHADYVPGGDLETMIRENLVAERIAIDSYRDMIQWFGDKDPTSRRMLEEILAQEEEHADDMASLLTGLKPHAT